MGQETLQTISRYDINGGRLSLHSREQLVYTIERTPDGKVFIDRDEVTHCTLEMNVSNDEVPLYENARLEDGTRIPIAEAIRLPPSDLMNAMISRQPTRIVQGRTIIEGTLEINAEDLHQVLSFTAEEVHQDSEGGLKLTGVVFTSANIY